MRCPACKQEMIVVEHAEIELDYCVQCEGLWFDASELELLFEAFGMDRAFDLGRMTRPAEAAVAESSRSCPACGELMNKVLVGDEPAVMIDQCPYGHGLWFDGGELGQVVSQALAASGAGEEVVSFLGETFRAGSGDAAGTPGQSRAGGD